MQLYTLVVVLASKLGDPTHAILHPCGCTLIKALRFNFVPLKMYSRQSPEIHCNAILYPCECTHIKAQKFIYIVLYPCECTHHHIKTLGPVFSDA